MKNMHKKNTDDIVEVLKSLYQNGYGGISKIFCSFYFVAAIFLTIFMCGEWFNSNKWIADVKNIIPSLLGFSLAGYTLLSTFGDDKFRKFMSQRNKKSKSETMYMQANSAFVHFIIIQLFSLLLALIASTFIITPYNIYENSFSFLSTFVFAYALLLTMATVLNIYRIARVYQAYNNGTKE